MREGMRKAYNGMGWERCNLLKCPDNSTVQSIVGKSQDDILILILILTKEVSTEQTWKKERVYDGYALQIE